MEKTVISDLNTENKFLVDWFSFTSKIHGVESIINFLGLNSVKFQNIYGCQGYKDRLYYDGINIHYNSARLEGVWVEMSGQGCRNFETFSKLSSFLDLFSNILDYEDDYHITRLDVAFDDFHNVIPLKKFSRQVIKGHFVSKFQDKSCTVTQCTGGNGITIDLGSRKSAVKFRIYDKAFERGYFDDISNGFSWTRFECQLRDSRASNFLKRVVNENSVGDVFKGVVLNYFRPVKPNKSDSNKRRWDTSKWFSNFIGECQSISVFTKCCTDYNIFKCEDYVYHQAGNAIYTLFKIKGDTTFFEELIYRKPETSLKYKELYNKYLQHMEKSDK